MISTWIPLRGMFRRRATPITVTQVQAAREDRAVSTGEGATPRLGGLVGGWSVSRDHGPNPRSCSLRSMITCTWSSRRSSALTVVYGLDWSITSCESVICSPRPSPRIRRLHGLPLHDLHAATLWAATHLVFCACQYFRNMPAGRRVTVRAHRQCRYLQAPKFSGIISKR